MTDENPHQNLSKDSKKDVKIKAKEEMDEFVLQIRKKDGSPVTLEDIQKILKEKGVIDGEKITQKDIDQLVGRMEEKVLDFSHFLKFMEEFASETKADIAELHERVIASLAEEGVSEAFKETALNSIKDLQIKMEEYINANHLEISLEKITDWFTSEIPSNSNEIGENSTPQDKTNTEYIEGKCLKKDNLKKFFEEILNEESIDVEEFKKKFDNWSKKENGKDKS